MRFRGHKEARRLLRHCGPRGRAGLGEFGAVLMFAGAIAMKTETLPMALFINMTTGDIEKSVAAAIILLIISAVVLVAVEHWGKETGVEYV